VAESHVAGAPLTRRQIREAERAAAEAAARAERERESRSAGPAAAPAARVAHSAWDARTATPPASAPRPTTALPAPGGRSARTTGPDAPTPTPSWVPTERQAPAARGPQAPASRAAATSAIPSLTRPAPEAAHGRRAARPADPQQVDRPTRHPAPAARAIPTATLVAAAHEVARPEPVASALGHAPAARVVRVAETARPASAPRPAPRLDETAVVPAPRLDETVVVPAPRLDELDAPAAPTAAPRADSATLLGPSWAVTQVGAPTAPQAATGDTRATQERPVEQEAPAARPAATPAPETRAASEAQAQDAAGAPAEDAAPSRESRRADVRPSHSRPAGRANVVRVHSAPARAVNRTARHAARFGVVGALALVTVAVPLGRGTFGGTEVLSGLPSDHGTLPSTVVALTAQPGVMSPPASLTTVDSAILEARGAQLASRDWSRQPIPGCDPAARPAGANGLLARADLCTLWDGHTQLRADAASALAELNAVYVARFGADMCIVSGYRTLQEQYSVKARKGGLAAAPGKSNHGWGLAIDFCSSMTTGTRWAWLNENAGTYGFENPAWARPGGSGPYERWHWEYTKGVQADGEYYG